MNKIFNLFKTKKGVRTIFYIFIIFFIISSFILISDIVIPDTLYNLSVKKSNFTEFEKKYLFFIFKNQGILIISLFFSYILVKRNIKIFNIKNMRRYISVILILLIWVLISGRNINGAKRWISIFGFSLQPSELSKISVIFLVIYLYMINQLKKTKKSQQKKILCHLVFISMVGLILVGKALSNTMQIFILFFLLLIFFEVTKIKELVLYVVFIALTSGIYILIKGNYIINRLRNYGSLEQAIQSQKSYTLGGLFGSGMSNGIMKYFYLPERDSDYIMAIIGEEFGFVGIIVLSLIFISFVIFLIYIASKIKNIGYRIVIMGFSFIIINQFLLHMFITTSGVSTGVPLPFYSSAGSFSITLGILIMITNEAIGTMNLKDE